MLIKSPYFWRTLLGYVIVALIGTFLFAATLIGRSASQIRSTLDDEMRVTADLLVLASTPLIQNLNYPAIRDMVGTVSEDTALRITIIDNNGVVLADSHEDPYSMNNHLRRPEIQAANFSGEGRAERYSYTLEENFTYLAKPVRARDGLTGFVRVAKPEASLRTTIRTSQLFILQNAAIMAFVILLLAFYLAARQAGKVAELTRVAEEIAGGNFARRIPEGNSLGFKRLAEAINGLARTSARGMTEITSDRNRLSTIFTCMVEGVIDVDMDQNILHINEAAARLLSLSEKQSVGKPLWQEIRNQEIINAMDEAIRTQSVIKTQMRLNKKAGQQVVDIYAASLSDDNGEPIVAVLVLHDISELESLGRVRTDFVANASHELKTPITAIRGLAETILGDEDVDKPTLMHFVERMHAQSLRLSQLVGDLMTLSRLENSQNKDEFVSINFTDLVRRAVKAAVANAEQKHQALNIELPEEDIQIFGDRQNLSQLVDNLIDNAIKYTPEEGSIFVSVVNNDGIAQLQVRDTGIGISPQYQQRVFERFYRVDKARSQSLGGTGLGLSIVKNIAEKHGGSVGVESQLGSGSTFTLKLPLENLSPRPA